MSRRGGASPLLEPPLPLTDGVGVVGLGDLNRLFSSSIKVIRKFFLNHNKSFRWHLGDYEKHIFFHLKACERRNFKFLCVFTDV